MAGQVSASRGSGAAAFPTSDKLASNLRKGVLESCVLALLAQREWYGLELADELAARDLSAGAGSLYPLLGRMRGAGLVLTRWDTQTTARPRRYYAITPSGRAQLRAFRDVWRATAPQVDALLATVDDGPRPGVPAHHGAR